MPEDKTSLEKRSLQLRQELKEWEKCFSADNEGSKASRDDIKAHPEIAAKYKEYNKVRDILSGKTIPTNASTPTKKRRSTDDLTVTPSKRQRAQKEPLKRKDSKSEEDVGSADVESTPTVKRTMMGPTPQRDGKVLGIFDLLPNETPSKLRTILGYIQANIARTPSKPEGGQLKDQTLSEERVRGSRTPTSSGKRFMLDSFLAATPSNRKRKLGEEGTPSSSKRLLATPAFLRRDTFALSTVDEEPQSPEMVQPWKRRTFGRSLSSMIQDRRKEEDDDNEDEDALEAMREYEDMSAPPRPGSKAAPKTIVEDSQRAVVLDAEGFVPSDVEEMETEEQPQLDRNGKPKKAWKKKGLKRQTRRVIMRPVMQTQLQPPQPHPEAEDSDNDAIIKETKPKDLEDAPEEDNDATSDYNNPSKDPPDIPKLKLPPKQKKPNHEDDSKPTKKPGKGREIKPEAHANYVKLKIKNQNSKAKQGKGRFGRSGKR